ncbi:hypothetical protein [Paratractidigestivibacter sp.]|uniref:hypothetical protein n=1 Tax=Paratractidigestivibacter sp. TaxID=2847316 RepID=UPI002ABE35DD|nr:hypothetical protein [Paratractidigestivibacter sp.]
MTEKNQALPLNDDVLDEVAGGDGGGASLDYSGATVDKNGFTTTERFYCPKCGAEIFKETKLAYVPGVSFGRITRRVTVCHCPSCNDYFDPERLKNNPDTYWHAITKTF